MNEQTKELWRSAGRCYARARRYEDAGRCYREAGDASKAAEYYERAGMYEAAAEQYQEAGQIARASWMYGHYLRRYESGRRALGQGHESRGVLEREQWRLARARCEAGMGHKTRAVRAVLDALQRAKMLPAWERCKLREWAVGVAEGVKRPDLAIRAHVELRGEY
ncbi:MAG: soluble NSF attachment family protein, partial [Proteobacteria bacterium]|nr:soluble NSF attachment family protein [Pseudomonadota bacterium]